MHLIAAILLVIAVAVLSGWYVLSHRQVQESSSDNFVPGEISVTFNDGVTFAQAKELITSFNLNPNQPDSVYQNNFTPWDYRAIKADKFDQIANKLKASSDVESFGDASNDGSSRAGPGYKWVKVTFRQGVTMPKIISILNSSGLGLGETPDRPVLISRIINVAVPPGQEDTFIHNFKQSSIVDTADRIGLPLLQ